MPVGHLLRSYAVVSIAAATVFVVEPAAGALAQSSNQPLQSEAAAAPAAGTTKPIRAVSLRAGPDGDAPVIGTLHPGDQLEIVARANYGWTKVRSPAGTGWAYGSYLESGTGPLAGVNGTLVPPSTGTPATNAGGVHHGIISP